MNENRVKRNKLLGERVIQGLDSRNMEGFYAASKEEALKIALCLLYTSLSCLHRLCYRSVSL